MRNEEKSPKNFQEFLYQFRNDSDCWSYLFQMRWPTGFICPRCKNSEYWVTGKPLLLWFHIMWWVVAQKTGSSANNLKEYMGFGNDETAWAWLHKLRRAMVRPGREKLEGEVEVDETYIGGEEKGNGKQGRGAKTKTLVVVATECIGKQIGRVRFRCIDSASSENLMGFIRDNVKDGSQVITDGWEGYTPLCKTKEYHHVKNVISGSGLAAHELLPHVHMVDSLVKRWINGTHQGKISPKYLPYYLDEYAFRFNRKRSTYRGKLFFRLVQQAVTTPPVPLHEVYG